MTPSTSSPGRWPPWEWTGRIGTPARVLVHEADERALLSSTHLVRVEANLEMKRQNATLGQLERFHVERPERDLHVVIVHAPRVCFERVQRLDLDEVGMNDAEAAEAHERRVEQVIVSDQVAGGRVDEPQEALGHDGLARAFDPQRLSILDQQLDGHHRVLHGPHLVGSSMRPSRYRARHGLSVAGARRPERETSRRKAVVNVQHRAAALGKEQPVTGDRAPYEVVRLDADVSRAERRGVEHEVGAVRSVRQGPCPAERADAGPRRLGIADGTLQPGHPRTPRNGVLRLIGPTVPDVVVRGHLAGDVLVLVRPRGAVLDV
jgi:hypothetical protein